MLVETDKLVIGASLSDPHTSVTALCTCVCMLACLLTCLLPYSVNFKSAHLKFNIMKVELIHSESRWVKPEGLLLECSVGYLELKQVKLDYTWQLSP